MYTLLKQSLIFGFTGSFQLLAVTYKASCAFSCTCLVIYSGKILKVQLLGLKEAAIQKDSSHLYSHQVLSQTHASAITIVSVTSFALAHVFLASSDPGDLLCSSHQYINQLWLHLNPCRLHLLPLPSQLLGCCSGGILKTHSAPTYLPWDEPLTVICGSHRINSFSLLPQDGLPGEEIHTIAGKIQDWHLKKLVIKQCS